MKIPFTKMEIFSSNEVQKQLTQVRNENATLRALNSAVQTSSGISPNQYYNSDWTFKDMQDYAKQSSVYRQVLKALQFEIFRKGGSFQPKFVRRCTLCQKDFKHKVEKCNDCGGLTREPRYIQTFFIKPFFEKCNDNGDNVIDVCQLSENDYDTIDRGFQCLGMEYDYNAYGEIIGGQVKEFFRIDPCDIEILHDNLKRIGYDKDGRKLMINPRNRSRIYYDVERDENGQKLYQAGYKAKDGKGRDLYYLVDEIIYNNKFEKDGIGYPPFLTLNQKLFIELNQDWFINQSYQDGRPPNAYLFVKNKNPDSLKKMVEWVMGLIKMNPHTIVPIGVDTDSGGQFAQYIPLLANMQEMQATEFREVLKREIGALFFVSPVFQNDISTSGGMNNEGLQITVTNRAVEVGQTLYNTKVFPRILKAFGVTDFEYILNPSEEKDEMAELQRKQLKIQNAAQMKSMGFDVTLNEEEEFEYSRQPVQSLLPPPIFGLQETPQQDFSGSPESVSKAVLKASPAKKMINQSKKVEESLEDELKELLKDVSFKKKLSKQEHQAIVAKMVQKFGSRVQSATEKEIKDAYLKAVEEVEKQLNVNLLFNETDKNAIQLLTTSKPLTEAYAGMTKALSDKFNKVIEQSYTEPGSFSIDKMVEEMKKAGGEEESRLRTIARTETTKVSNVARFNSYAKSDPKGEDVYKWIGPDDHRTTSTCKEITQASSKGLPLDSLKQLVFQVAKKNDPKFDPSDWLPHCNCRHTFVKVNK